MSERLVLLSLIRIDGGMQPRVEIDLAYVSELAERIAEGEELPAVKVYFDGVNYFLADGFHRYHATRTAGKLDIFADVVEGTQRDAILYSVGANWKHGLRRSSADKQKAVETLLQDAEWMKWSDREIARRCNVSPSTVAFWRERICPTGQIGHRTVQRGETIYEQYVGGINANRRCTKCGAQLHKGEVSICGLCRGTRRLTESPNMPRTDRDEQAPARGHKTPGVTTTQVVTTETHYEPVEPMAETGEPAIFALEELAERKRVVRGFLRAELRRWPESEWADFGRMLISLGEVAGGRQVAPVGDGDGFKF